MFFDRTFIACLIFGLGCLLPSAAVATEPPLNMVPTNSGVFIHARFGTAWTSPVLTTIKKSLGKYLDKMMNEAQSELGFSLDIVDTATLYYPVMPQGPGDETTFILIVTTNKPYDKDAIFKARRIPAKGEKKDGIIQLKERFVLNFRDATTFLLLHESLLEKYVMKPLAKNEPGVMSEAIQLAQEKHHFVFSLDFSKLPNEIFTAPPPELQPFLPILKTRSSVLFGDIHEKAISLRGYFHAESEESATDAERSLKLLLDLAVRGLQGIKKDKNAYKDIELILPAFNQAEKSLEQSKIARTGKKVEVQLDYKISFSLDEMLPKLVKKLDQGAAQQRTLNNLRQIGIAMHNYHALYNGLPASTICDKKGKALLSWRVAILPYVEQDALYKQFHLDEPWDSEHNKKLIAKMPKIYQIDDKKNDGTTHYCVFTGNGAVFDPIQPQKLIEIADGTSNTLMVATAARSIPWTKPEDLEFDPTKPVAKLLLFKDGTTPVAFCDGSARFLNIKLADKTWNCLIQKNDGMVIEDPNY